MGRSSRIILGACLILLSGAAQAEYTSQEWEVLKTGEVSAKEVFRTNPEGTSQTQVEVKVWIKAPREEVWKTIRDYEHFHEFMPNIRRCKVVQHEGDTYWVAYQTSVLGVQIIYHQKFAGDGQMRHIDISLDETRPNEMRNIKGYWQLDDAPEAQGTILTYSIYLDPGFKVPEGLARKVSKPGIINVAKNVRSRVESGGTWKKSKKSEISSDE